jgi:hypothetical protein
MNRFKSRWIQGQVTIPKLDGCDPHSDRPNPAAIVLARYCVCSLQIDPITRSPLGLRSYFLRYCRICFPRPCYCASMDIQSMCNSNDVVEHSKHSSTSCRAALRYPSPDSLPSPTAIFSTLPQVELEDSAGSERLGLLQARRRRQKKKCPLEKTSYMIPQSNFSRIAPKLSPSNPSRQSRASYLGQGRSSPDDPLWHFGAYYSLERKEGYDMAEIDFKYSNATSAERAVFPIPGRAVFQLEKCKHYLSKHGAYRALTFLALPTEATKPWRESPSCRALPRLPGFRTLLQDLHYR